MLHSSHGRWTAAFLTVSLMALVWVAAAVPDRTISGGGDPSFAQGENQPVKPSPGVGEGGDASLPMPPGGGEEAEGDKPDQAERPEAPEAQIYDFSKPVPEGEAVDKSYFDDAAFVGDSRTDGFLIYSGIGRGKNLTSNGLSIFKLEEKKALTIDGKKYTLLETLALEQYGKVYLSLGVNELGYYDDEGFYRSYCQAIDDIRALQPNAVIYIQGLIPLNEEAIAQTSGRTYLTNEHLRVYNELMRKAAEEKQVAYLDLYTEFADENGELPAEASKDGVHLRGDWCKQWLAYLESHTVDYETLYPNGAPQIQGPAAETEDGSENP